MKSQSGQSSCVSYRNPLHSMQKNTIKLLKYHMLLQKNSSRANAIYSSISSAKCINSFIDVAFVHVNVREPS